MSHSTLKHPAQREDAGGRSPHAHAPTRASHKEDIAGLLERMSFEERVRAYRSNAITRHELTAAAAREPHRMPMCNDEFEWIALGLADLD
jgi:hypothetical protein